MKNKQARTKDKAGTGLQRKKTSVLFDLAYIAAIFAMTAVCYKLFYRMCTEYHGKYMSDFSYYIEYARTEGVERHRLLSWLFGNMNDHGIGLTGMVAYLAAVIAGIVLFNKVYLRFYAGPEANRHVLQIASILIPFMGPMYIPVFHEYYYRWSFNTFAWHSPTEQSMILFSIPALLCFVSMYEKSEQKVSAKWWILTAVTGLLSTFAKPAFMIDLILAMIIMFLADVCAGKDGSFVQRLKKCIIMGSSLIPSGIYMLLVMNDEFQGASETEGGGIIFDIKHVLEYENLFAAIVCGLAFPIIVWVVNYKLIREKRYKTVVTIFVVGILQWALLYEEGIRATHGNFSWGRQAGCYFMFITAVAMAIRNWNDKTFMNGKPLLRRMYFIILGILLLVHILSQLHYFYMICMGRSYMQ